MPTSDAHNVGMVKRSMDCNFGKKAFLEIWIVPTTFQIKSCNSITTSVCQILVTSVNFLDCNRHSEMNSFEHLTKAAPEFGKLLPIKTVNIRETETNGLSYSPSILVSISRLLRGIKQPRTPVCWDNYKSWFTYSCGMSHCGCVLCPTEAQGAVHGFVKLPKHTLLASPVEKPIGLEGSVSLW